LHDAHFFTGRVLRIAEGLVSRQEEDYRLVDGLDETLVLFRDVDGVSPDAISRFYLRGLRTACGFMLGHGQYVGDTLLEDVMTIAVGLTAAVCYRSFIGLCIHMIMKKDKHKTMHWQHEDRLNKYMGRTRQPQDVRDM